jgi:hypothetical protein
LVLESVKAKVDLLVRRLEVVPVQLMKKVALELQTVIEEALLGSPLWKTLLAHKD